MNKLIKYLTLAAAVAGLTGMAYAYPVYGWGEIQLTSGATTITIQDNQAGDANSALGQIVAVGLSLNGWTLTITAGETKPFLGSSARPEMDLGVQGGGGNGPLTIKFSDLYFGPTNGALKSTATENGTSVETSAVYMDAGDAIFALTTLLYSGSVINDASSYSLTLVDTFTPGTISADHRITVPDGGTTALLLGLGLLGMGLIRRSRKS